MKKIKVFLLPYAGGSATIYNKFSNYVNNNIEIIPIELAGRGHRIVEDLYETFEDMIVDITNIILNYDIEDNEFALFGYSMGALLAYEVAHRIKEIKNVEPKHIFLSAGTPANIKRNIDMYKLSDDDFTKEMLKTGGISKEISEEKTILEFFIPIIKNDMRILNEYEYEEKMKKIKCPVSILYTEEDKHSSQIKKWDMLFKNPCEYFLFEGDHFFIYREVDKITAIINNKI